MINKQWSQPPIVCQCLHNTGWEYGLRQFNEFQGCIWREGSAAISVCFTKLLDFPYEGLTMTQFPTASAGAILPNAIQVS